MDITSFVVKRRNDALLVGDYGSYRQQLSRQLLTLRRRLGRTSSKGKKYTPKAPITAQDVCSNPEHIQLILLTSERAWAHAMHMKSMHAADSSERAITGATKSHIKSRLWKAEQHALRLVEVLKDPDSKASPRTLLEAQAYRSMLQGGREFEAQQWAKCIVRFSNVHVVYTSLAKSSSPTQGEVFQELLSAIIDPSIRYAAYQLRLPRTLSIQRIVSEHVDKEDELIQGSLRLDPSALDFDATTSTRQATDVQGKDVPRTITWRSRTVNLEDANIAQALAHVTVGEQALKTAFADGERDFRDKAAAYDQVLNPSQDAVDATKTAIDELTADGVAQADERMQALQITRTAVNYALVSWRIGRNRTLCGESDGATQDKDNDPSLMRKTSKGRALGEGNKGRRLARIRERVVLYDSTLQSLESIMQLPGVAADSSLLEEIENRRQYFAALRCFAIGRSHAILHNTRNALALFARSQAITEKVHGESPSSNDGVLTLEVTEEHAENLQKLLKGLVAQYRALAELEKLSADSAAADKHHVAGVVPLIERLDEYPATTVDLTDLVVYPLRVRPIPVKPIFLDLAWNYVDYPQHRAKAQQVPNSTSEEGTEKKETRKGWFGFGR